VNSTTNTIARLDDCYGQAGGGEVARGGEPGGAGANNQN
jgi:hypothetical protein